MFDLPDNIISLIYEFDPTMHDLFQDTVLNELRMENIIMTSRKISKLDELLNKSTPSMREDIEQFEDRSVNYGLLQYKQSRPYHETSEYFTFENENGIDFISDMDLVIPFDDEETIPVDIKNYIATLIDRMTLRINGLTYCYLDSNQIFITNSYYKKKIRIDGDGKLLYVPLCFSVDMIPLGSNQIEIILITNRKKKVEIWGNKITIPDGKKKQEYMNSTHFYLAIECRWASALQPSQEKHYMGSIYPTIMYVLPTKYLISNNISIIIHDNYRDYKHVFIVNQSVQSLQEKKRKYAIPIDDDYCIITTFNCSHSYQLASTDKLHRIRYFTTPEHLDIYTGVSSETIMYSMEIVSYGLFDGYFGYHLYDMH